MYSVRFVSSSRRFVMTDSAPVVGLTKKNWSTLSGTESAEFSVY